MKLKKKQRRRSTRSCFKSLMVNQQPAQRQSRCICFFVVPDTNVSQWFVFHIGLLGEATVAAGNLPTEVEEEEEEPELDEMQRRLEALKS